MVVLEYCQLGGYSVCACFIAVYKHRPGIRIQPQLKVEKKQNNKALKVHRATGLELLVKFRGSVSFTLMSWFTGIKCNSMDLIEIDAGERP